jgi:hypothetical protein
VGCVCYHITSAALALTAGLECGMLRKGGSGIPVCWVPDMLLPQQPACLWGADFGACFPHCATALLQQHINNLTLLAMNRPPQAHTKNLLQKLRDNIPGLALRTTFISGRRSPSYVLGHGAAGLLVFQVQFCDGDQHSGCIAELASTWSAFDNTLPGCQYGLWVRHCPNGALPLPV